MARGWDLDLDEIRRHYVCELYSGGQDLLAQEVGLVIFLVFLGFGLVSSCWFE